MKQAIMLARMHVGQRGIVRTVRGGRCVWQRLGAMGIRPGQEIIKTSGPFMRGPVIVRIGNAQVALGFGMAQRVVVEIEEIGTESQQP